MASMLEQLLAQLAAQNGGGPGLPPPAPSMPIPLTTAGQQNVPEYTPSMVTEPPQAPIDPSILAQYLGLGPQQAPTPPAPLSRGQRIANALMGFGAGVQGNGPQFLQQLQEPQREYQRQLERFNETRSGLALRGQEAQLRDREQRTRRAQEVSDQQLRTEIQRETRRLRLTDDREKAIFEDLLANRRDRERAERETKENERKERALLKRQVDLQMDDRIKAYRDQGAGKYAEELARSDFRRALADLGETVPPLSKAAAKANVLVQARLQRALRLAQGGGGTAAKGPERAVLEDGTTAPLSQVKDGRVKMGDKAKRVVGYTGGGASSQPQAKAPQGKASDPLEIR